MAGYWPQGGDRMLPAIDCAQLAPSRHAWTEIVVSGGSKTGTSIYGGAPWERLGDV
jgi:hypothetical protein